MSGVTLEREDGARLVLDLVRSETYAPRVALTEHPIEDGSPVVDHAQRQPDTLELDVVVSASPASGSPGADPVGAARAFFEGSVGKRLRVYTLRYGRLDGYMLEGWPHQVTIVAGAEFKLSLKQIRIATATVVAIPAPAPKTPALANPTTGTGTGAETVVVPAPGPTSSAEPSSLQSTLSSMLGYFTG